MSTRRILHQKKAISPILATLLLIVIAVAAIVVTYAWITTYMGSTAQQAGVILYPANVAFNTTTGAITIDVQNTGNADTKVAAVYVGDSASTATQQTPAESLPLALGTGKIVSLTINDYDWTAGETYYFKVVPTTGPALSFQEQAPQTP